MIPGLTYAYDNFCQNVGDPIQLATTAATNIKESYNWLDRNVKETTERFLPEPLAKFSQDIFHTTPVIVVAQTTPAILQNISLVAFNIFKHFRPELVNNDCIYAINKGKFYSCIISAVVSLASGTPIGLISAVISLLAAAYFFYMAS